MPQDLVAALDIGGTKIAGALVDSGGGLLHRTQRPTPARESAERMSATVDEVLGALTSAPEWHRVRAVGIGSAGPVDAKAGTVSPVNIPVWRDHPLVAGVRERAGGLPISLVGDGVAIAAAEHWQGAARGRAGALCMVVSTGVGGGLILDGVLHPGPSGNAGHIGHISVDMDGELCPCGSRGCVETLASGTNIARRALDSGWHPAPGQDATAAGVAAAAREGDPLARAAYARAARALAAAIAATATLVEIEIAVIGGGVARAGEVLFEPLREELKRYATLSFVQGLDLAPATTGTDAGLVGAAAAGWKLLDDKVA
ncbi:MULTISPECIES: ROK family protein [unclassified Streptomyces]|uniref:ROK family protein n=1 Tax=unclassified Streptomyces TaxID=2593676 RepID=UPI002DDB426C|nr:MULTISPECIES: ROK family protein [unclassified Streptomyces]WSA90294.1 ROK family protein [Streptomyces sp. NBC_01795]WSB74518.1 ROK family protein [Streptomyces sp. NBC_01775]WSS17096.1 ROK family protein [Streptomyces sp. NBC_01186]WSS45840.1 ROK family protein [Streptomyces sp. NBC_01187]